MKSLKFIKTKENKLFSKMRKTLKNKKGSISINYLVSFLIFLVVVSFMFDMFVLSYKQFMINKECTAISNQIGHQSGIMNTTPFNFPGGDESYVTVKELYDNVDSFMRRFEVKDWSVEISSEGKENHYLLLDPSSSGFNCDYGDYILVKINYNYKWNLWSNVISRNLESSYVMKSNATGEYLHDFSGLKNED